MIQKIAVNSHKTTSLKPPMAVLSRGNRQQATGNRQQATGNRQQATGNRQLYTLPGQSCQLSNSSTYPPICGWNFPTVHSSFSSPVINMRDNIE
jgi:hypothetical protein